MSTRFSIPGRWRGLFAAIAAGLVLTGCGDSLDKLAVHPITVGTDLAAEQVIRRQLGASPRTLDPSLATDVVAQHVLDDTFEGLVTLDESAHIVPGVAKRWEISPDGTLWTFHLRDNARWSNGEPVTADDFVYAWRRTVDPKTASEYAQALGPIKNAMEISVGKLPVEQLGVSAPDKYTLVVQLVSPTPYFMHLLTNMYLDPLYRPAIEKWGDTWTKPGHMVSNGPFVLESAVINGSIDLVKNPYYWAADTVRPTRVKYVMVSDAQGSLSQYLAGSLDWTGGYSPKDAERLTRLLGEQVVHGPYFGTTILGFNMTQPPFKDAPKLRRAMVMALDRKIIAKYVEHDIVTPAYQIVPPLEGYTPAVPDWAKLPDDARHALARKLYHEAGYSDDRPLRVRLTYPSGGADARRFLEALSAMWRMNLGAEVQLYDMQWKVLLQSLQYGQLSFFWNSWIGDFPDPFTFLQLYTKGFPQNHGGYDNPEFDRLVAAGQATPDIERRYHLFAQAEKILNDDGAYVSIYFYPATHLVKPYLKGWKSNVIDRNLSRYMYILEHKGD